MGDNGAMKLLDMLAAMVRASVLVAAIWLLVGLIMPIPDPFLIAVGGLTVGALMVAVRPSRRVVRRWVLTGRLRPTTY
jgi:hypothetical protein